MQSQALRQTPAETLGLTEGSYEAYCLNQAVWYYGSTLQSELEKAGRTRAKGEAKTEQARTRVLSKYLGKQETQKFADPSALFN